MNARRHSPPADQRGTSLIEVIMFVVIISIAVSGVMLFFVRTTAKSADPLIEKQALAIAESLLEEVRTMPFTYCDPNDANASTAASPVIGPLGCAAQLEGGAAAAPGPGFGADAGETRYAVLSPFDNVNDYNGFAMGPGIVDITNTPIGGGTLGAYSATVTVAKIAAAAVLPLPPIAGVAQAAEKLLITVTVTGPNNVRVILDGVRIRYAPTTF